jgi:hypothetical protein
MAEAKILGDGDMFHTGAACPACHVQRLHTEEELRRHHPMARHGVGADGKWTHPEAQAASERDRAAIAAKERAK